MFFGNSFRVLKSILTFVPRALPWAKTGERLRRFINFGPDSNQTKAFAGLLLHCYTHLTRFAVLVNDRLSDVEELN